MKAYTYILVHKTSGKFYYGVRYSKNCDPDDLGVKYFSSSKMVKTIIKNEGKDSFHYKVRKIFDDRRKAIEWENKILKKFYKHPLCLNQCALRGWYSDDVIEKIKQTRLSDIDDNGLNSYKRAGRKLSITLSTEEHRKRQSVRMLKILARPDFKAKSKERMKHNNPSTLKENKIKISNSLKEYYETHESTMKGKKHSFQTLKLLKEKKMGRNNPCYGKIWVNNGIKNLRVYKDEIPDGYVSGRLYKRRSDD
jgi:hypothetical protein